AVDHDGFETVFAQCERRMTTAIVKLNALANAVGSAAQDDDLLFRRRWRFVFFFVRGIEIRRVALKLRGTRVHQLINRTNPALLSYAPQGRRMSLERERQALIRRAHAFGFTQKLWRHRFRSMFLELLFDGRDLSHLIEKPGIDSCHLV